MKPRKIVAIALISAVATGALAGCNEATPPTETADTTQIQETDPSAEPTESEVTSPATESSETTADVPVSGPEGYRELEVASGVTDEDDEVVVCCFDGTFADMLAQYSDVTVTTITPEAGSYRDTLDRILASGDEAPDLFLCDISYASDYFINDSMTLPINSLGISYSELGDMYDYTLQLSCSEDNVIKGLTWQATPCGVFYNKALAEELLGVSDPQDIEPMFATWDSFLNTARTINQASGGERRIVSGVDDIWRNYTASRSNGWISGGHLYMDPVMENYFDLARSLTGENLTFGTMQWDEQWEAGYTNGTVFSYFEPLWIADLYLNNGTADPADPYATNWGLVRGPSDCYWGGTWMAASVYCDSRASVAQIMRDIAIDRTNLEDMARNGVFVNNRTVMETIASDASEARDWLGGQNPAVLLTQVAEGIDTSLTVPAERRINEEYMNIVSSYVAGDIETVDEAREIFQANITELGII